MNKFLKNFFKWFLLFSPLYILLILACTLRIDAYVYLPGNLTDVEKEVAIEGYDKKLNGQVSSVYVMDITRPTYMTYALASLFPFTTEQIVSKQDMSSYDKELEYAIGTFDSERSFSNASLAAFDALKDKIDFSYKEVTYIYSANKDIEASMKYKSIVGKLIKRFGDSTIENPTMDEVKDYFSTINPGEEAKLILEDSKGVEFTLNIKKNAETSVFGITIMKSYLILSAPNVSVKNVYTQGPSGGAMQALYMYLLMNDEDILKGRKIAGTGTINYGTTSTNETTFGLVGAIGCVGQKLYGAYKDGAKIFYCPKSNYSECMSFYNKYGFKESDIRVVSVETLSDIINDLRGE